VLFFISGKGFRSTSPQYFAMTKSPFDLSWRVAPITGSVRGLGQAGATPVLTGRTETKLRETANLPAL
jgi:hypothetical protein